MVLCHEKVLELRHDRRGWKRARYSQGTITARKQYGQQRNPDPIAVRRKFNRGSIPS